MISNKILSVFQSQLAKLLLIGCTLVSLSGFAAAQSAGIVNFSGTWEGVAPADNQGVSYKWVIRQQGRNAVGTVTVSNERDASAATYSIRGTVEGSQLNFEGEKLLALSHPTTCTAAGSLTYIATEDDTPTLSGEWHENAVSQGCLAGTDGEIALKNRAIETRLNRPTVER
jgi:hypothetical protein